MAGLGGMWIEALKDVALRVAPIDADEALAMLDELKGRKLLAGVPRQPADRSLRLARLIADLSQWFCAAAWLDEIDLNPSHRPWRGSHHRLMLRMRIADARRETRREMEEETRAETQ